MNAIPLIAILAFGVREIMLCAHQATDVATNVQTKVILVAPDGSRKEAVEGIKSKELVGDYKCGDGLGYNLQLILKEGGRFDCIWRGCLGEYGKSTGEWTIDQQGLKLASASAEGMLKEKPLGRLYVVRFREHFLLLPVGDLDWFDKNGPDRLCCLHKQAARDALEKERRRRLEDMVQLLEKRPTKVLLFKNTGGESLEMAKKDPIRRVLDANGKVILDLDPAKAGSEGQTETENLDSRVAGFSWWRRQKRDSLSMYPQSRGAVMVCLESDSGRKELFEIIVLDSAVAVPLGGTLSLQSPSKKPINQIEVKDEKVLSAKVDPADPTRAMVKGLARGFTTIRLRIGFGDLENVEVVVHPEKTSEDKVFILSPAKTYRLRMTSGKEIAQVENSDDKVLEISTVTENPEQIRFMTRKPGFSRLKLGARDNSMESFTVFVKDTKR
jgi:hypothetical protein